MVVLNGADGMSDMFAKALSLGGTGVGLARQLMDAMGKPTDKERDRCVKHIKKVGKRDEAYEDILWALVNSTEFQTRR